MTPLKFSIQIGEELPKKSIHKLVGGSDMHAMTSCLEGKAFLLFHDPISGKEFGYDVWEGQNADDSFSYTGQGVEGNQKLTNSNLGLIKAHEMGRPIYFFKRPGLGEPRKKANPYTYIGEVTLASPPYTKEIAPDKSGNLREVFVFKLIPLGAAMPIITSEQKIQIGTSEWIASATDSSTNEQIPRNPSPIEYGENKLQKRFFEYLTSKGEVVFQKTIKISDNKGSLKPDFFLEGRRMVVEAKPSSAREYVRLAIGQVLDYQNLLKEEYQDITAGILLPQLPARDLIYLCKQINITIITEVAEGEFSFHEQHVPNLDLDA